MALQHSVRALAALQPRTLGCGCARRMFSGSAGVGAAEKKTQQEQEGKLSSNFGSFHSPSVEDLISINECDWPVELRNVAGPPPVDVPFNKFGSAEMKAAFCIDFDSWAFLNHGAFGATPRCVMAHAEQWRAKQEQQPLQFFDRILLPELVRVMHRMGHFMSASPCDIALVPNATTALNIILQSLGRTLTKHDSVLYLDIAYGSVKKMITHITGRSGIPVTVLQVPLPIASPAAILDMVHEHLRQCAKAPSVVVLDHITSNTALRLPLAQLAELIKTHGPSTRVVVDGAHGLLQTEVDMAELRAAGVSYYAANCHKWMCSAKSVGVLWAAGDEEKECIEPVVISHGHGSGFTSEFVWDGCRDYAPALSLCTAIDFIQAHGVEQTRRYCHDLLCEAATLLRAAWGTGGIVAGDDEGVHRSLHACMALVQLPPHKDYSPQALAATTRASAAASSGGDGGGSDTGKSVSSAAQVADPSFAARVQDWLFDNRIEVPVKAIAGNHYVRISAHMYNALDDYRPLADLVSALPNKQAKQ